MRSVAVIEDNLETRLLTRILLERIYEVWEYETGFEALADFEQRTPDLVLLDISLPHMDGTEVLAALRERPALRHLPVVAFTAYASETERQRYLASGFDEHISKPITDKQVFLAKIEALLAAREGSEA
jgi:chemosensory pili system protein ChpA (sensor histidine kinase/response regulator)